MSEIFGCLCIWLTFHLKPTGSFRWTRKTWWCFSALIDELIHTLHDSRGAKQQIDRKTMQRIFFFVCLFCLLKCKNESRTEIWMSGKNKKIPLFLFWFCQSSISHSVSQSTSANSLLLILKLYGCNFWLFQSFFIVFNQSTSPFLLILKLYVKLEALWVQLFDYFKTTNSEEICHFYDIFYDVLVIWSFGA